MRSGGHLRRFDSAPQDGVGVEAAKAADSRRHPVPNVEPRHSTMFTNNQGV